MDQKSIEWKNAHLIYKNMYHIKKADKHFFSRRQKNPINTEICLLAKNNPVRILEAGCGSGADCVCLALHGYKVIGVDISEHNLNEARILAAKASRIFNKKLDIKFEKGDIFNLSKYRGKFDFVFNFGVIQARNKEQDRLKVISNMENCLKAGGKLIIAATNTANLLLRAIPKKELVMDEGRYNLKILKREVKKTGFKIIRDGHIGLSETFDQWLKIKALKYPLNLLNDLFYLLPASIKSFCAPHSYIVAEKRDKK